MEVVFLNDKTARRRGIALNFLHADVECNLHFFAIILFHVLPNFIYLLFVVEGRTKGKKLSFEKIVKELKPVNMLC